jgi:hypothetical protein
VHIGMHWNCRCVADIIADQRSNRLHGAFVETVTDVFADPSRKRPVTFATGRSAAPSGTR